MRGRMAHDFWSFLLALRQAQYHIPSYLGSAERDASGQGGFCVIATLEVARAARSMGLVDTKKDRNVQGRPADDTTKDLV